MEIIHNNIPKEASVAFEEGRKACAAKDFAKGHDLFEQAAELGKPDGWLGLGNLYHRGDGVEQDLEKAIEYYIKAGDGGVREGYYNTGVIYLTDPPGYDPKNPENSKKTLKDEKKALEYLEKASALGDFNAYFHLAHIFYSGPENLRNYDEGFKYLSLAAEKNFPPAMVNLGQSYMEGKGCEKDEDKAAEIWQKAADMGDPRAMFNVAANYALGRGVNADLRESYKWLRASADLNFSEAVAQLIRLGWDRPEKAEREEAQRKEEVKKGLDALLNNGAIQIKSRNENNN